MTKYIVIKAFRDLQDNMHLYREGDKYPRRGRAKKERIEELLTDKNRAGVPLIAEVKEGDE